MAENHSSPTLWTIGHSSAEAGRLLELLQRERIEILVDVRAVPYSRYVPHANRDVLEAAAEAADLSYVFMGDSLGARPRDDRPGGPGGKPDYARIAEDDSYRRGIDRLIERARAHRVCIMCSEEDPARCHRGNLISPTLASRGFCVLHIRHSNTLESQEAMDLRKTGGQLTLF